MVDTRISSATSRTVRRRGSSCKASPLGLDDAHEQQSSKPASGCSATTSCTRCPASDAVCGSGPLAARAVPPVDELLAEEHERHGSRRQKGAERDVLAPAAAP